MELKMFVENLEDLGGNKYIFSFKILLQQRTVFTLFKVND
jgi:hypothetical protein